MKALATLALLGALVRIGPTQMHESCKPAPISFNLPKNWVVNNEQTLFEVGFIVPPMPLYAVVASPSAKPYRNALLPSAAPWVLVTLENVSATLPPAETYELTPQESAAARHPIRAGEHEGRDPRTSPVRARRRPQWLDQRGDGRRSQRQYERRRLGLRERPPALAGHCRLLGVVLRTEPRRNRPDREQRPRGDRRRLVRANLSERDRHVRSR